MKGSLRESHNAAVDQTSATPFEKWAQEAPPPAPGLLGVTGILKLGLWAL